MNGLIYRTAAPVLAAALLLAGCGSGEKYELREDAIAQMERGDYAMAAATFDKALQSSDGFVGEFELDVLKYRAEAEYLSGDYEAAAETYGILCQVDEKDADRYRGLRGTMYILNGQPDEAASEYEALREKDPDGEDTQTLLLALGKALEEAGRHEEAAELFEEAMNSGMKNGELYHRAALTAMDAGDADKAMEYINEGLDLGDESGAQLLIDKAAVLEQEQDFSGALSALEDYERRYGRTEETEKEIAFLKTR